MDDVARDAAPDFFGGLPLIETAGTFEDALRRLQDGEGDAIEITLGFGDPLEVVLDPELENGLLLRAGNDGTLLSRILPPLPEPPEGYPSGLPFVADRGVTLSLVGSPDRVHLVWFAEGPVEELLDELLRQSREAGWGVRSDRPPPEEDTGMVELELLKDGRVRTLLGLESGAFGQVTLIEEGEGRG